MKKPNYRSRPRSKYCGVYLIIHLLSGRMYVGGSTDITGRYTFHRYMLRRGLHSSRALQELWTRDGEQAFEFRTLEYCAPDVLLACEQAWLDAAPDKA